MPCTASTRGRSGARCARSSRPSSRPGSTRATSTSARSQADFLAARKLAEAVQAAVRGATSLTCSLGVASCKVVAKVASDRRKPGGLTVVRARAARPRSWRRSTCACSPGVGPRAEERLRERGRRDDRRPRRARRRRAPRLLPGKVGSHCSATAPAGSTSGGSRPRSSASRSRPRRPSSGTSTTASSCTPSFGAWRAGSASTSFGRARRRGRSRRRCAIRTSRSAAAHRRSQPASTTGRAIGDIACALLDRALADRPGPATARRRRRLEPRAVPAARAVTRQAVGAAAAAPAARSPRPRARPRRAASARSPAQTSAIASNRAGSSPAAD